MVDQNGKDLPMEDSDDMYLKASDLQKVAGIDLKPINTVAQAEKNK